MQRHLLIAASPSQRRLPPRPSPLPRQQPTPSPAARDGGRGASATANSKIWFVKRKNRPAKPGGFCFVENRIGRALANLNQWPTLGRGPLFGAHRGLKSDMALCQCTAAIFDQFARRQAPAQNANRTSQSNAICSTKPEFSFRKSNLVVRDTFRLTSCVMAHLSFVVQNAVQDSRGSGISGLQSESCYQRIRAGG